MDVKAFFSALASVGKGVARGFGGLIEFAGKKFNSERIEKWGKNIQSACSSVRNNAKQTASTENIRNESASRVKKINEIFSDFHEQIENTARDIENACIDAIDDYFQSVISEINCLNQDVQSEFDTVKLQKKRRMLCNELKNFIAREIEHDLSIDSVECQEILKIEDDDARGIAMEKYSGRVFSDAIDKMNQEVQTLLKRQNEEMRSYIDAYIEKEMHNINNMKIQLKEIEDYLENTESGNTEMHFKRIKTIMYLEQIEKELA